MALQINHRFVSPKSDGADASMVRPSNWNESHNITTGSGGVLLGRLDPGGGDVTGQTIQAVWDYGFQNAVIRYEPTVQMLKPSIKFSDTQGGSEFELRWNSNVRYMGFHRAADSKWFAYTNENDGNWYIIGSVQSTSDRKFKTDIATIQDALALVNRMRGVFFTSKITGQPGVGVIAQEMQEVVPQVVSSNDEGLTVGYGNLVGVLIEAIKELTLRVEMLEGKA